MKNRYISNFLVYIKKKCRWEVGNADGHQVLHGTVYLQFTRPFLKFFWSPVFTDIYMGSKEGAPSLKLNTITYASFIVTFFFSFRRISIRSEWSAYHELCGGGSMVFWLLPCRSRRVIRPSYFYSSSVWFRRTVSFFLYPFITSIQF